MDDTPLKQCLTCLEENQWHPATAEFFYPNRKMKDGLLNQCKACVLQKKKERLSNPEAGERKRASDKAYNSKRVSRETPDVREHRIATHKAYARTYYERPDVREHRQSWYKIYYNLSGVKERYRTHAATRLTRKKGVPGKHTPQESREQYQRQKGKCYYCSLEVTWGKHHEDHIIPITREGCTNDISNIAITCATCNQRKGNKLPHEFFEGGKLL